MAQRGYKSYEIKSNGCLLEEENRSTTTQGEASWSIRVKNQQTQAVNSIELRMESRPPCWKACALITALFLITALQATF